MRRHDTIRLTKEGLFGERYSKQIDDRIVEGIRVGGKKKGEFFWRNLLTTMEVDKDVTLLDFIKTMAKMNADELHALSVISNCNLAPHLIDFAENPDPQKDDDGMPIQFIEVYRCMEYSNYDLANDVYDLNDYTCAHGIGEIWKDSMKEVEEGRAKLKDVEHCNAYAIEFTPWQKMLSAKIRIREFVYHSESTWKKIKPKPWMIGVVGSKKKHKMGMMTRDLVKKDRVPERKIRASMNLSQFFTGLFNELCFFSSPSHRDGQMGVIKGRMKDVEKQLKKEKKKK